MSSTRGSVLVEGALLLVLASFVIILQIELCRRVWVGIVVQVSAFESVRASVLGFSETKTELNIASLVRSTLPFISETGINGLSRKEIKISQIQSKAVIRRHVRYSALVPIESPSIRKRNFEVTQACSFPFSH